MKAMRLAVHTTLPANSPASTSPRSYFFFFAAFFFFATFFTVFFAFFAFLAMLPSSR